VSVKLYPHPERATGFERIGRNLGRVARISTAAASWRRFIAPHRSDLLNYPPSWLFGSFIPQHRTSRLVTDISYPGHLRTFVELR
jgi:hypothetical protein